MSTLDENKSRLLKEFGFDEEEIEYTKGFKIKTGYPKPDASYRIVYKAFNQSLEQTYFYFLGFVKEELGYPIVEKITDVFSASEQSNLFGSAMQKLGLQQDRASNLLANLGKLVKDLFQLVRDLRITDERLKYYEDSKTMPSADVALKGIWADTVDANDKTGQSIFALAQRFDYAALPTFFFNLYVKDRKDVDSAVESLDIDNNVLKNILKRKLYQYLNWKEETYKQLTTFRNFYLNYLLQHYNVIQLYISWLKPYLKNIQNLHLKNALNDRAELIKAFENAMIEIEVLARKPDKKEDVHKCLLLSFTYFTKPQMIYTKDYQRAFVHVGEIEMNFRAYVWTNEEYKKFKEMKERENLALLASVDQSIQQALDALGDDLKKYLEEARKRKLLVSENSQRNPMYSSHLNKSSQAGLFSPFVDAFSGFFKLFSALFPKSSKAKEKNKQKKVDKSDLKKEVKKDIFLLYNIYKKTHGLLTW